MVKSCGFNTIIPILRSAEGADTDSGKVLSKWEFIPVLFLSIQTFAEHLTQC